MRIIDPYRKENARLLKWLAQLSEEDGVRLLKECGILDARGNLARKYRTPKDEVQKPAKPKSPKTPRRKRAAS